MTVRTAPPGQPAPVAGLSRLNVVPAAAANPRPLPASAYALPPAAAMIAAPATAPASASEFPFGGVPLSAVASRFATLGQLRPVDHILPVPPVVEAAVPSIPQAVAERRALPTVEAFLPSGILEPIPSRIDAWPVIASPSVPQTSLRTAEAAAPALAGSAPAAIPAALAKVVADNVADSDALSPALVSAPAPTPTPSPSLKADPLDRSPPTKLDERPGSLHYLKRGLKLAGLAVAGYLTLVLLAILVFRFVDPPTSMLMVQKRLSGLDVTQEWMPLEEISPNVVRAVLVSEDGRFCQHGGVDFEEMQNAIERAGDGTPRGASTISMQVVKNLFLWPSKSYIRKAIEIPLTYAMELVWSKRRIMEVYLNIAEWGPGVFGVEAASQFHFNKRASRLSEREAARLAVALPNPLLRDAGDPGPMTMRLAGDIQSRMRAAGSFQTACVLKGG